MIRRKRLVVALVLFAAAAVAVHFAAEALVRRALISAGESATGARVEIGRTDGSLIFGQVALREVTLADPERPARNLLEIGEVSLDLDTAALMERKLVADSASLRGLRIGTPREGARDGAWEPLDPSGGETGPEPCSRLPQLDEAWIADSDETFWSEIERGSEAIQWVRSLAERWPGRIERLGDEAAVLSKRAAAARESLKRDDNVLRRDEQLRQAAAELQTIRHEAQRLNGESQRLVRESLAERETLGQLVARDQERLAESLGLDPLRPEMLTDYLLGREVDRRVESLVEWLRWMRKLGGQAAAAPGRSVETASNNRGELPDFLIRGATLGGEGELFGRTVRFHGYAWGITSQPERYGGPMLLDVQTEGAAAMRIRAGVDRSGPVARERIVVDCPRLSRDRLTLGNPEQLCLAAAPGTMRLAALLETRGDGLVGHITLDQETPLLEARLGPGCANARLARRVQAALGSIEGVSATVQVAGTLERPRWQIETELGPWLAGVVQRALREELEARRKELAAQLESRVQERLAAYEQLLAAEHNRVAAQLRLGDEHVRELWEIVARRSGMPRQARRHGPATRPPLR